MKNQNNFKTIEQKINGSTVIICSQNSKAYEYNKLIRLHYFKNQQEIAPNDKIMVLSNNYNYEIELLNGDFGLVLQVANNSEIQKRILKQKNNKTGKIQEKSVLLSFKDALIRFWDTEGQAHDIKCKILENTLKPLRHNENISIDDTNQIPKSYLARDISSDEMKAIYIDAKIRFSHKEPAKKENTPDEYKRKKAIYHQQFKEFLRQDPYFNALRIKYGYAITCHKAQGGEWQNPIVNFQYYNSYTSKDYFRWSYTALTRAKNHLLYFNAPEIKVTYKIVIHPIEKIKPFNIPIKFETNTENITSPFHDENYTFLIFKYNSLKSKCKNNGINITNVQSRPKNHFDRYTFKKEDVTTQIDFFFNKKQRFTTINIVGTENELSKQIIELDKSPILEHKEIIPFVFKSDDITKQKIYEFVENVVESNNSIITYIEVEEWCLNIHIKTNAETAFLKIHHKKNGFISKIFPLSSLDIEDEILNKICISLQNNKK